MQKRLKQVLSGLREHSYVSFAKIATVGGFCNVDLIVVKATAPDDLPLPERYIQQLMKIFSISPLSYRNFSLSFIRRFGRTRNWRVALKCLLLLHRLLRTLPEDSPFRAELLWTRSNGLVCLSPCRFRDESSSTPEDYTAFIRSYAKLLDEALDCLLENKVTDCEEGEEEVPESLPDKMKEIGRKLELLPQLQGLIDLVMACRPTGTAARSFVVQSAMKRIIRDSFVCYTTFRREIALVLDSLFQMPYRCSISAFGICKKAALQATQLCEFYDWCRSMGLCGSYEYPFIDRIPQIKIQALETFLNGMWQLTESSSSTTNTTPSTSSLTDQDDGHRQIVGKDTGVSMQWEKFEEKAFPGKFEEDDEEAPLIQFEDTENDNWESILEASVNLSPIPRNNLLFDPNGCGYGNRFDNNMKEQGDGKDEWKMQVYNPNAFNPFCQPYYMPNYYPPYANSPRYG